jgi:hypothetical protein
LLAPSLSFAQKTGRRRPSSTCSTATRDQGEVDRRAAAVLQGRSQRDRGDPADKRHVMFEMMKMMGTATSRW